ncbi:MAG TPA: hypothetical protein VK194_05445, partial [Candidatus Deferrimicrobium sp.]|nr:hypothetical protein [Candidatus Deferrimicrobium sp.]
MTSSDRPRSRPPRPGRGRLLGAAATVIAVVAIGLAIDLPRSRQGHVPATPGPSASAAADGRVGLWAAELPKVDPDPWTAVTWHVVPGAIAKRPVLGL